MMTSGMTSPPTCPRAFWPRHRSASVPPRWPRSPQAISPSRTHRTPGRGIHIVGGFDAPVIGGENPREHPRNRLHKAQDRQNALVKRVRTLEIEAEHRAGIPSLDEQHQKAWAANQEAARALTDRDQNISRLNHLIRDEAVPLVTALSSRLASPALRVKAAVSDPRLFLWDMRWPGPVASSSRRSGRLSGE